MTAEPNAALVDAAALVAGLFASRQLLLAAFGKWLWARWTSRWLRRGMIVAIIVPALRLTTLAIGHSGPGDEHGQRTMILWLAAVGILAAGAMLVILDIWLASRTKLRPRQTD